LTLKNGVGNKAKRCRTPTGITNSPYQAKKQEDPAAAAVGRNGRHVPVRLKLVGCSHLLIRRRTAGRDHAVPRAGLPGLSAEQLHWFSINEQEVTPLINTSAVGCSVRLSICQAPGEAVAVTGERAACAVSARETGYGLNDAVCHHRIRYIIRPLSATVAEYKKSGPGNVPDPLFEKTSVCFQLTESGGVAAANKNQEDTHSQKVEEEDADRSRLCHIDSDEFLGCVGRVRCPNGHIGVCRS